MGSHVRYKDYFIYAFCHIIQNPVLHAVINEILCVQAVTVKTSTTIYITHINTIFIYYLSTGLNQKLCWFLNSIFSNKI